METSSPPLSESMLEVATNRLRELVDQLAGIRAVIIKSAPLSQERAQAESNARPVATRLSLAVLEVKRLNRLAVNHTRGIKEATEKRKHAVDREHLRLQNLLYEKAHLLQEIEQCREYASIHDTMELVSVEELLAHQANNPASGSNASAMDTSTDKPVDRQAADHQTTIARLGLELQLRKELHDSVQTLNKRRLLMDDRLNSRNAVHNKLPAQIEAFLKGAEPLRTELAGSAMDSLLPAILSGTPMPAATFGNAESLKKQLASPQVLYYHQHLLLPRPLLILFVQLCGYREAFKDHNVSVSIEGNLLDARAMPRGPTANLDLLESLKKSAAEHEAKLAAAASTAESGNAASASTSASSGTFAKPLAVPAGTAASGTGALGSHVASSVSTAFASNSVANQLFRRHPLHVSVKIGHRSNTSVTIEFFYLVHLNMVTCRPVIDNTRKESGSRALSSKVLAALFPDDIGRVSPNPSAGFFFARFGVSASFNELLHPSEFAYRWAQSICGLESATLPVDGADAAQSDSIQYQSDALETGLAQEISARRHVMSVVDTIANRLGARQQLMTQLFQLDSGKPTDNLPVTFPLLETSPSSSIPRIKSTNVTDFEAMKALRPRLRRKTQGEASATNPVDADGNELQPAEGRDEDEDGSRAMDTEDSDSAAEASVDALPVWDADSTLACISASLQHGSEVLKAVICLPVSYPIKPSVVRVGLVGAKVTEALTSDPSSDLAQQILDLEHVLNVQLPSALSSTPGQSLMLFSVQIRALQAALLSYTTSSGQSLQATFNQ
ncbi:hypothetical protein CAOG_00124 [Capsaspora owczarzaki ATCC 30864]|uniref:THO complex subunit 5 n=1 Tax=Capsaspora owczarzaki (strain ATCC 30864) TaxID=595528 RepID=A0A0D2WGD5_CAPO3|nr:hypothetical protein CAOG_00124 [Capsaspora owczarzaki ATCC 30864]KJE88470.1 hypothetical protein CAOG_000124 [Capsaspora owczarzaki ATCC 30864]|eukprot:XP_004364995.2 hypothetical protein CAOG_00124 [Capsaspora owczarzaki ATCC 30864]